MGRVGEVRSVTSTGTATTGVAAASEVDAPPTAVEAVALVAAQLRAVLPAGWALADVRPAGTASGAPDAAWALRAPAGEAAQVAVWARAGGLEPQLDAIAAVRADGVEPFLVAPFLSASVRERLVAGDLSHGDATGNLRLVLARPGVFIERFGATKDPWPTGDALRTLRGRAAGRAIRALVDHAPPFGVRDIAKRASVPLGSLARTLDLLDREGLVTRGPRGDVRALDWEGAVRRWAIDYELARSNRLGLYTHPRGPEAFTSNLLRPKRPYAVSGLRGAQLLLGRAATGPMVLYVEDLDLGVERLGLEPAEGEAADVVLAEGYDRVVFDRPVLRDGLRVAAPSQLAADLLTGPPGSSGPRAAADEVLAWMRADPSRWQHPSPSTTDHEGAAP
jgi:hypothetical protein